MGRRVREALVVDHCNWPRTEGDGRHRSRPKTSRDHDQTLARRQEPVSPRKARDLEEQPAKHPVHVADVGHTSKVQPFDDAKDREAEPDHTKRRPTKRGKHVGSDRRIDRVVGEEPQWDRSGDRTGDDDAAEAEQGLDGEQPNPGSTQNDGGSEHSAESCGDPIGAPASALPATRARSSSRAIETAAQWPRATASIAPARYASTARSRSGRASAASAVRLVGVSVFMSSIEPDKPPPVSGWNPPPNPLGEPRENPCDLGLCVEGGAELADEVGHTFGTATVEHSLNDRRSDHHTI